MQIQNRCWVMSVLLCETSGEKTYLDVLMIGCRDGYCYLFDQAGKMLYRIRRSDLSTIDEEQMTLTDLYEEVVDVGQLQMGANGEVCGLGTLANYPELINILLALLPERFPQASGC